MRIRGILAPLTTPFDHRGNIYWSKLEFNISQLLRTQLAGIALTDRWGEGPLLSAEERTSIWTRAAARAGDTALTVASISGCGVAEARQLVEAAAEAGCTAAVVEAPDLTGLAPSARASELFFRCVADTASLPLLVGTQLGGPVGLTTEQVASLASHPRIAGAVVEGLANKALSEAAGACGPKFAIVSRDFPTLADALARGASAALLPLASAVPFHALSIEEAVRTRQNEAATGLTRRATDFDALLRTHGVPALKHSLDQRSFFGGPPRLPLLPATPAVGASVNRSMRELAS